MDLEKIRTLLSYKKLLEERSRAEMMKVFGLYESESLALEDQKRLKKNSYEAFMEEAQRGVLAKEGLLYVDYLRWLDRLVETQRELLERVHEALEIKRQELGARVRETKKMAKVEERLKKKERLQEARRLDSFQDTFALMLQERRRNLKAVAG